jgi:tetratricopeptide (TPR) repeat protein
MNKTLKEQNKRTTKANKKFKFMAIGLFGVMLFSYPLLWGQEVDPFYLKLLNEGEKSYLDKNYKQAIKKLEIAVFGLSGDNNLVGKAYLYISLSHLQLKDRENCELNIRKALDLVGVEGLEKLKIDESARDDLKRIIDYFKIGKEEEEEEPEEEKPKKPEEKVLKSRVEELEKKIEAEPQNLAYYYELYELYRGKNNVKAARKIIQELIKNNPDELIGPYLMGKIEFSQNSHADALRYFNQVLKPFEEIEKENVLVIKSLIYVSLCLHYLNRQTLHDAFVKLLKENTSEAQLRLMLKEEDLDKEWKRVVKEE